jgi:hypothetical protein
MINQPPLPIIFSVLLVKGRWAGVLCFWEELLLASTPGSKLADGLGLSTM